MATIARVVGPNASEFGCVCFDKERGVYGWERDDLAGGPFDTAEDAGRALADDLYENLFTTLGPLRGISLQPAINAMLRSCREHDDEPADDDEDYAA